MTRFSRALDALESITLLDVDEAVEPGATLCAMHRATPNQECPVGLRNTCGSHRRL